MTPHRRRTIRLSAVSCPVTSHELDPLALTRLIHPAETAVITRS
jgi:hypothetical protein